MGEQVGDLVFKALEQLSLVPPSGPAPPGRLEVGGNELPQLFLKLCEVQGLVPIDLERIGVNVRDRLHASG